MLAASLVQVVYIDVDVDVDDATPALAMLRSTLEASSPNSRPTHLNGFNVCRHMCICTIVPGKHTHLCDCQLTVLHSIMQNSSAHVTKSRQICLLFGNTSSGILLNAVPSVCPVCMLLAGPWELAVCHAR